MKQNLKLSKENEALRENILGGNILKMIFSACAPMALFQLLNQLFKIFDYLIVGQIDTIAVSAISFFSQLTMLMNGLGLGVATGGSIVIAGYYGKGEFDKVKKQSIPWWFMVL